MRPFEVFAVLGVSQEIGLTHIKIEVNRIKRHKRREQRRWTRRCATASDQISRGNEMRAHTPCERRGNPAMVEVELGIPDAGLRVFDRSARGSLIGYALVHVFDRSSVALLQIFGTVKLPVSQLQSSRRNLKLGVRFGERDFVGAGINREEEITLPHDVPVLKKYSSERAAYLRAQLHLRDGRKLTKEAQPRIDVLRQRLAHHDLWKCS